MHSRSLSQTTCGSWCRRWLYRGNSRTPLLFLVFYWRCIELQVCTLCDMLRHFFVVCWLFFVIILEDDAKTVPRWPQDDPKMSPTSKCFFCFLLFSWKINHNYLMKNIRVSYFLADGWSQAYSQIKVSGNVAFGCPQDDPRWRKTRPRRCHDGTRKVPRWVQNQSTCVHWFLLLPRRPKMVQDNSKTGPIWFQHDPQMAPRWF